MARTPWLVLLVTLSTAALAAAPQKSRAKPPAKTPAKSAQKAAPPAPTKLVQQAECPSPLGEGVKSQRGFCDLAIATDTSKGVVMRIPPHKGASTLQFDLHNRFAVSGKTLPFASATALVAVVNAVGGAEIGRAAVTGELRKELDLFDRISGSGPGGTKAIAPGRAQPVKITLPAAVSVISIVGLKLEAASASGREVFTTAGRPIAIVSNLRLEYTPSGK
jgi:hypothetical protein